MAYMETFTLPLSTNAVQMKDRELILKITDHFMMIIDLNPFSGKYSIFKRDLETGNSISLPLLNENGPDFNFYSYLIDGISSVVIDEDRDVFSHFFSKEHMISVFNSLKTEKVILRLNTKGKTFWIRVTAVPDASDIDSPKVIIGCKYIDKNKIKTGKLGTISLSPVILDKADIGLWAFEFDRGKEPRMYADETTLRIINMTDDSSPEEKCRKWTSLLGEDSLHLTNDAIRKMSNGEHVELQFKLHHPDGHEMTVRCSGTRNLEYTSGIRIEGIFRDITELICIQEEKDLKAAGLESAFSSLYQVAYYIDLELGRSVMLHGDDDSQKFSPIFDTVSLKQLMDNFHSQYVDVAVVEEDRERVKSSTEIGNVYSTLKESNSMSVNYRVRRNLVDPVYTEMSMIKARSNQEGIPTAVIIAFRLIQNEVLDALELSDRLRQDIMTDMLGDEGLFLINVKTGHRKTIHNRYRKSGKFNEDEDYEVSKNKYIDLFVADADKEVMRRVMELDYLTKRLRTDRMVKVEYRDTSSGISRFYEMRVAKFSENEILQSFADKDTEIVDRMIQDKLEDDYFSIIVADLDANLVKVIKKSPFYTSMGNTGDIAPYSIMMRSFASRFEGETLQYFEKISHIPTLISMLTTEDKLTYSYKSTLSGDMKWISMTGFVLGRHADGTPSLVAMGFGEMDTSAIERKELQERLTEALAMAQAASQSKSAFLFNMSHDIRTPMNAIAGFTTMAKKDINNPDKVGEYLDKITIAGDNLLELINKVLDMARIESGKVVLEQEECDIIDRTNAIISIVRSNAEMKDILLESNIRNIRNRKVLADNGRINQILLNILGNAIKYTPEGGTVKMTTSELHSDREGYASFEFKVEDTGIGISKQYLKTIFEPFTREKTVTQNRIEGTGLGMSIVKRLVDLMEGNIGIQSEPGHGTTISITLSFPIPEDSESVSLIEKDESHFNFNLAGKRILLVEDNELNREIAKFILEDLGLIVDEADDGDVAVSIMGDLANRGDFHHYDFILMDIQMPRMDGYEAAKAIRAIPTPEGIHIPIIAMTANAFDEDRQNAIAAGMDDHLSKPIDILKLNETLAKWGNTVK